jgi:hypothetical protein
LVRDHCQYIPKHKVLEILFLLKEYDVLEQEAVDLRNLKHIDIDLPVYPKHTIQEWLEIFAAQKAPLEKYANFKKGTTPQPGNYFSHGIVLSFSVLYFYMGIYQAIFCICLQHNLSS